REQRPLRVGRAKMRPLSSMTGSTPGRRRAAGLAAYGLAFAVAGATPLAGCRGEPTSIVIQVNTNLTAATEVDEVHIIVVEVGLGLQPSRDEVFKIRGAGELPVVLGLYPSGDPRIDVDVSARAALQGCLIAEQRASTHFVPDHVERLTI